VTSTRQPVLYAITTGATPAQHVDQLVALAQRDGWDVCVICSPDGRPFIDADRLASITGHTVRSTYKDPAAPDELPPADGMIVAPATCNTLAKWAAGISDTLHLGLVVEAVGKHLPVVAVPFSNRAQISFPAVQAAMASLADWGVTVVRDEASVSFEPGNGAEAAAAFPWARAWNALLEHPWRDS
jgi:phosphopantothenoylcysteine synthetase/decarboxylase